MLSAILGDWRAHNPVRIVFGGGALSQLPELVSGHSLLLLTSAGSTRRGLTSRVAELLNGRELTIYDRVETNVELASLESAAGELRSGSFDAIVAVGGGSVIDSGKVLSHSLLAPAPDGLRRHLERGDPMGLTSDPLPVFAVPTTAGTGAEVTPFATVWDGANAVKHSFASGEPYPRVALLDPELTLSMPDEVTLTTGLDALSQGLESSWANGANPLSRLYARRAVQAVLGALPSVMRKPDDLALRTTMMEASLLAGLAIAISRTTLSHSISYPLTLHFGVPHGLACAFTLAQVLRFNSEIDSSQTDGIAADLGFENAGSLADQICEILSDSGAYGALGSLAERKDEVLAVAPEGITPGRANNKPRPASVTDVEGILDDAIQEVLDHRS